MVQLSDYSSPFYGFDCSLKRSAELHSLKQQRKMAASMNQTEQIRLYGHQVDYTSYHSCKSRIF